MKRLKVALNIALLTVIAGLSVNLFYGIIGYHFQAISSTHQTLMAEPVLAESKQRTGNTALTDYQTIISRDLFNVNGSKSPVPESFDPTKDLQATDLKIKLWGTVTGKNTTKYAVIEAMGPNQRTEQILYREGDVVESAVIEQILNNKIILSHDGQRRVLAMEKFLQGDRQRFSPRANNQPRIYRRTISRDLINHATQNFNQLISQARVVPDANGMKISAIQPDSIFRRLGLRNGDIINSVNNRRIQSMADAMEIYRGLQYGRSVSLQLLRHGRPQTIEYRVQ
ncbi:MAG: PDZ domain-containing protein [Desulfobacteraceae bacterium]|nr:PDZ domain-containing protein [Desulfobacteraceae bacterium]